MSPSDTAAVIPLHHRVYVVLRQKMLDGSYPAGRPIPSEDALAESFGVSRVTLRKAMDRLAREGLVTRQRGRGTFPVESTGLDAPAGEPNALLSNQKSLARRTRITVLEHRTVRLDAGLARLLEAPAGSEALRVIRKRHDERSPISWTVAHLPPDIARLLPRRSLSSLPISATLAARGVPLGRVAEHITATLADAEVAGHLGIDSGSALIRMVRQVRDGSGRVVELLQALYRPDRYEYRVEYTADDRGFGGPWRAMMTDTAAADETGEAGRADDRR